MDFLTRLKIGQRLGLGFTLVLVLTVATGLFALNRITRVHGATTDLATNWLVAMRALGEYQFQLTRERRAEALYVMTDRPEQYEAQVAAVQTFKQAAARAWKRYADTVTAGEEQKLAKDVQQAQRRYDASLAQVLAIPHAQVGFFAAARAKYVDVSRIDFDALAAAVTADIAFQSRGGDAAYKASQDAYDQARLMIFALLIGAITIGASLAWFITRSITRPIARAVQVAETVAAGDLSSEVRVDGADETARLLAALKRMNDGLVTIVSQVLRSSDSIATGSNQIASGNADLSQRT
ncbi:MAG: MCP four helix bundle domain-containing protein, partial [Burkholderiales bacterium]|nr:MCP four helix bundle domain-containing protein [Burkholderiales bacterium]